MRFVDALCQRGVRELAHELVDRKETWVPLNQDVENDSRNFVGIWQPDLVGTTLILHGS